MEFLNSRETQVEGINRNINRETAISINNKYKKEKLWIINIMEEEKLDNQQEILGIHKKEIETI